MIAVFIEAIEIALHRVAQYSETIISEIGFEPRVEAGHHRDPIAPRIALGAAAQPVRGGEMDNIWSEGHQIALDRSRKAQCQAIFSPAWYSDRRYGHDMANAGG